VAGSPSVALSGLAPFMVTPFTTVRWGSCMPPGEGGPSTQQLLFLRPLICLESSARLVQPRSQECECWRI
jgi:hypothetical protein